MGTAIFPFSNNLASIVSHAKVTGEPILLVHDQGLYLMTSGLRVPDGSKAVCAYALGCDPSDPSGQDGIGWYDRARDICGGDDFAEQLSAADFAGLVREGASLKIKFSETHLTMTAS